MIQTAAKQLCNYYFTGKLTPFMEGFVPLVGNSFYNAMTRGIFAP